MLMLALLTSTLCAQTPVTKSEYQNTKTVEASYYPQTVSWWDSGNGFICKYTVDNLGYITRYDKQGNYIETLIQKVWNDSSALRPSFQQSQYKSQKVISYWVVADANRKGYYLEVSDSKNQISSVWVDALGTFSTVPTANKPKQ